MGRRVEGKALVDICLMFTPLPPILLYVNVFELFKILLVSCNYFVNIFCKLENVENNVGGGAFHPDFTLLFWIYFIRKEGEDIVQCTL